MPITFEQIMACHPENLRTYQASVNNMKYIVPFVGAGLCVPPYKSWKDTLRQMADHEGALAFSERIRALLKDGKYEEAATALLERRGHAKFDDDFTSAFDSKLLRSAALSDAIALVPTIFSGAVVTTNFDRTLDEAYSRYGEGFLDRCIPRMDDYSVIRDRVMVNNAHYLIQLHGDIENFRSRVLTTDEYNELYGDIGEDAKTGRLRSFPSFLKDLFQNKRFLFLGSSLESDRTMTILQLLTGRGDVKHFAILPLPEVTKASADAYTAVIIDPATQDKWDELLKREQYLSNHNVFPIWYPNGQHDAVELLLRHLRDDCRQLGTELPKQGGGLDVNETLHRNGFFGRDDLVMDVLGRIETRKTVCLFGAPGIGKSEVCEELMHRHKQANPRTQHLAVYLQGAYGYSGLLTKLGQALMMSTDAITEENVKKRLEQYTSAQPVLLYLDNFEDVLATAEGEPQDLSNNHALSFIRWVDRLAGLRILLSCRERIIGGFDLIEVTPLQTDDAWQLFQRVWVSQGGNTQKLEGHGEHDAKQLIRALDNHPLSIVLLASQAAYTVSTKALLEAWHASCQVKVDIAPNSHNEKHKSLNASIYTSYLRIKDDSVACAIWGFCSMVPALLRHDVLEKLVYDKPALEAAIRRLIRLNLFSCAEVDTDGCVQYRMLSPLKRQIFCYVACGLPGSETYTQGHICDFYATILACAWPGKDNWNKARTFALDILDDMIYIVQRLIVQRNWDTLWPIHHGLLNFYQFRCAESQEIFAHIIEQTMLHTSIISKRLLANTKEYFGDLQSRLGQVDAALTLYQEAETLYTAERYDLGRANVLKSVGDVQSRLGQVDAAMALYQEAEKLYTSERDDLGRANVLKSMGDLQSQLGQVDTAMTLYQESEKLNTSERYNLGRANVLQSMGDLQRRLGKVDDAMTLYQEAQELYTSERANLGRANVLWSMGDLQSRFGQVDAALTLYQDAEKLYTSERDNLGRANVLWSMGDLQSRLGQVDAALTMYQEAEQLYISERANLGRANVLWSIGDLQSRLGQVDAAMTLYQEAEKIFTSERANLRRANVLLSMGDLQSRLGQVDVALSLYQEVENLFLSERNNLGRANVLRSMGDLQSSFGQVDAALTLYQEAEKLYTSERASIGRANVLLSMGDLQSRLGQVDAALTLYQDAEKLYTSERDKLGRANVLKSEGDLQSRLGQLDAALALYQEAEKLYTLERSDLGYANVMLSMGDLQSRLGQVDEALILYQEAEKLYTSERENLGRANALQGIANLKQRSGQPDTALDLLTDADQLLIVERCNMNRANGLKHIAYAKFRRGQIEVARKIYQEAIQLYISERYNLGRANALKGLADIKCRCKQYADALKMYREAEQFYQSERNPLGLANVYQSIGDHYQRNRSWHSAEAQYTQALSRYQTLKEPQGYGYTLAELCVVYVKLKDKLKLRTIVQQARAYLAGKPDMNAKMYLLERLAFAERALQS